MGDPAHGANGKESTGDGYRYIGRGLKQLTGRYNTEGFVDYVSKNPIAGQPTSADITANLDLMVTDKRLAARSAAWFWQKQNSNRLNAKADNLTLTGNDSERPQIDQITNRVNPGAREDDKDTRWTNYIKNVTAVLNGGNPYESMRSVLSRVGITTVAGQHYTQQFGITLAAHTAVGIDDGKSTSNLMAAAGEALSETTDLLDLSAEQEAQLWTQAQPLFDQLKKSNEDSAMWIPNLRDTSLLAGAAVAVVAASPVQAANDFALGVCRTASPSAGAEIAPTIDGDTYLYEYHSDDPRYKGFSFKNTGAKVTVIKAPQHGEVVLEDTALGTAHNWYHYMPKDEGYSGRDRFEMLVEKGGIKIHIYYLMEVLDEYDTPTGRCHSGHWMISSFTTPTLDNAALQALLDATRINNTVTTADLLGGAVGQTTGSSITLDTDAAGHGWYIDYTPFLNDEYLPTSNPLEWIAKPGSVADGKMDMLTVLLHEYGHALGLDHTADSHDLMASTLQPGVRRLPSAEELDLMAQLLSIAKETGSVSPVPYDPFSPPGTPLPTTISLAAFVAARQRRSTLSSTLTQFEVAANPTLTNPQFADNQGWATEGDVAIAAGAATLKETATTQTRLNQAFVVGPNDRFLSFTLSGIALDDVSNAPDDAFEVALIDANTGLSLLGGTGLSHNDAFLNLQADGTEYKASGVTTVKNADGSRTVLVDLAGIAAGTVVNLSFDLIGFGRGAAATSSHVTIKDLRLGVPQEAHNDTATLDEDATLDIDVVANDIGADQPGVLPVLVSGPTHGTVEITAEGRFRYKPAANWSGEDSFSYRLSDGNLDSNIAEVKLTVAPVNDAPVLAANTVTLDEDGQTVIDLLQGATDVDGDVLTATVTTAPQQGSLTQNADGTWTYVPNADWNGSDAIVYEVSDGTLSTSGVIALVVKAVNDAPVIAPRTVTLDEDGQAIIDLLQGATDVDGDVLTATVMTAPQHGSLAQNADGTWTYVPNADWNGSDAIVYEVSDGTLSTSGVIALVVKAINDAPVIAPRTVTLDEDGHAIIDLLQGATDVDADVLNATVVTPPQHGQLTLAADGSFIYVPDANWFGDDSFSFKVSDGLLDSNLASVTLTVLPVNDAPVVAPRTIMLDEDDRVVVDLLLGASDIDGDVLTAVVTEGPQHGSFERNADGTWTYGPNANWNGSDSVVYAVSDGLAVTTGRLAFVVRPVNDAPVASPIAEMLQEDGSLVLNLQASATDVDGDTLSISVGLPGHGQLTQNTDGTWTYRPAADYQGPDSFSWTVSDGQAATTGVVHLVINAVNDAPVALDDTVTVNEDGMAAFPLQASDVDGDVLTGRIVSQPTHGSVVQLSANSFSYVPQADWSGEDSFTYVVNDGQLDSGVATIRVIVTPVADAPVLVLNDQPGQGRELFRTGWESVCDRNGTSTLVQSRQLEGWTLITRPDTSSGGSNGFEIWSTDDKMMDAGNKLRTVSAMAGDGTNWLELNNSGGDMHQTLGIERSVYTVAGATYTLSLDLAGRLGYSADYTKIGIYVDGVRIGGDADISAATALNWQTRTFQFAGKGGKQTISIVSEATKVDRDGRGMMIDDIALVETLPANTGFEDTAIRLSAISAALRDTDGSEALTLAIEALPVGAILTDGSRSFTATPVRQT